jgi:hypothetical protein
MRGFIVLLVLLAAGVVALGFYLDWFKVSKTSDSGTNQTQINLTVDNDKIKQDTERAKERIQDIGERTGDKAREVGGEVRDATRKDRP